MQGENGMEMHFSLEMSISVFHKHSELFVQLESYYMIIRISLFSTDNYNKRLERKKN